ncbi:MAG: TIGR03960 family B12-binding radical SAM protein [Planctomycetes bacterium]|nr:TIGR03960 family B12-binding radical SAM protein [Planctomycetota bacterium]
MRNLATDISDKLLPRISRPGQYIGLETNCRWPGRLSEKQPGVAVMLAFPDAYGIGISHLGSAVLYHMVNSIPGAAADRTYCPWNDAEAVMREHSLPLFGWESRCAVADFDIVGFSLGYELCVTNVLTMLDLAGIPLHWADRTEQHPLIVGGDALADTPEPLAPFFDLFIPGDGEKPLTELIELVRRAKANGQSRQQTLLEAARTIESVYVPALYRPRTVDGVYLGLEPVRDDVPREILRAAVANLDESPVIEAPLVPLAEAVHDRVVIEVMRGCPNGCYFCQAGAARLPVRTRKIDQIVDAAKAAVEATGHNEISLLSLSTSDYPYLEELIARLSEEFTPRHVSISLPSLRVDSQLRLLPRLTSGVRKGGLTIAAEAGSERLRQAIGKRITEQDMIEGVKAAYKAGWRSVKVYFMAGLPGETPEDIDEIYHLCRRLSDARREVDGQRGAISASVSWLVPKPHTPMQWFAMRDGEYFLNVRRRLRDISHRSPVSFKFHRVERSGLEGLLCRGGREVAAVIENAWRDGARLDTWDEFFDWPRWQRACANAGVDFEAIVNRPLATSSAQPWSHIRCRQSHEYLLSRYHKTSEIVAQQDGPAQDPIQPSPRS